MKKYQKMQKKIKKADEAEEFCRRRKGKCQALPADFFCRPTFPRKKSMVYLLCIFGRKGGING